MPLILPSYVADSLIAEGEARRVMDNFRPRLKALDARLDVFLCDKPDPDGYLKVGYWYVYRRGDDGQTGMWEISNPDGSYREPDDAVIYALQRNDASRGDLTREWQAQEEAKRRAKERDQERKSEERSDRIRDTLDYHFRVQHRIKRKPFGTDA